nr:uncharacterized protein y4hO-like [Nerophis lumbriciformis]
MPNPERSVGADNGITIRLPTGIGIELGQGFDPATLRSVVLREDPFSTQLFVFRNRRNDKLKALVWDTNGFVVFYKRLERGRFPWPVIATAQTTLVIDQRQLQWLLSGLSIEQRYALPAVMARAVA